MRLHYFQHVPFEGLGIIKTWAEKMRHEITGTAFFVDDSLPEVEDIDFLVVMGGPMNIYEEDRYPWLKKEKAFIYEAIKRNKLVLGICLGAQLIADVLGAEISKNKEREIGWFSVMAREGNNTVFPEKFMAFHWHGDMFGVPFNAEPLAYSAACENQAFSLADGRVIALQFHLEVTEAGIKALIDNCGDELQVSEYVQSGEKILEKNIYIEDSNLIMYKLLDFMHEKIVRVNGA